MTTTPLGIRWVQIGAYINGEETGDHASGLVSPSVSLSSNGKIVAIGAESNDGVNGTNSGHVRVYSFNSTTNNWLQVGQDIDGEAAGDQSGYSVAISNDGTTVGIGAPESDNTTGTSAGQVRVYSINSTSNRWIQLGADLDGTSTSVSFGLSLAMSADGKTIVSAEPYQDTIYGLRTGQVRVYSFNSISNSWVQIGDVINGTAQEDYFGTAVAMSADGTVIAVGATRNDNGNGMNAGTVRVYKYIPGPTKSPTKSPTKDPTKSPTKTPNRLPTKAPTRSPTKTPTRSPTKAPIKFAASAPTNSPTKAPTRSPTKAPIKFATSAPTKSPTKFPSKSPTRAITNTPTRGPTKSPTSVPIEINAPTNCGLFDLNFFCPRRGKCGFWKRFFHIGNC
jgi:hypothetical protein